MIELVLIGGVFLLFSAAALAPIEALGWYAGWFGEQEAPVDAAEIHVPQTEQDTASDSHHFLVFLSGIGAIAGDSVPPEEIVFLDRLARRLPGTVLVRDVFPYSVTNMGLTGQRFFARLWRRAERLRLQGTPRLLGMMVNIRNMFQVAVSADPRYGPVYNLGVAHEIYRSLVRHGYAAGCGTPVTILGWSGGGQIALGSSLYLRAMIEAPVRVLSLGGVMSDDPGLNTLTHLYHLYGEKDPVQASGAVLYPGRWPMMLNSAWNMAMGAGKITLISLGPYHHNQKGSYMDNESTLPDGRTYMDKTLDTLVECLDDAGLRYPPSSAAPSDT